MIFCGKWPWCLPCAALNYRGGRFHEFWHGESGPIIDSKSSMGRVQRRGVSGTGTTRDDMQSATTIDTGIVAASAASSAVAPVVAISTVNTTEKDSASAVATPSSAVSARAHQDQGKMDHATSLEEPAHAMSINDENEKSLVSDDSPVLVKQSNSNVAEASTAVVSSSPSEQALKDDSPAKSTESSATMLPATQQKLSENELEDDRVWHLQFDFPSAALGVHLIGGKPMGEEASDDLEVDGIEGLNEASFTGPQCVNIMRLTLNHL